MKRFVYIMVILLLACGSNAQNRLPLHAVRSVELAMGVGKNDHTVAAALENNFQIGKQKRLLLGAGIRFTAYGASNKDYFTAPASLAKGATGPGIQW